MLFLSVQFILQALEGDLQQPPRQAAALMDRLLLWQVSKDYDHTHIMDNWSCDGKFSIIFMVSKIIVNLRFTYYKVDFTFMWIIACCDWVTITMLIFLAMLVALHLIQSVSKLEDIDSFGLAQLRGLQLSLFSFSKMVIAAEHWETFPIVAFSSPPDLRSNILLTILLQKSAPPPPLVVAGKSFVELKLEVLFVAKLCFIFNFIIIPTRQYT